MSKIFKKIPKAIFAAAAMLAVVVAALVFIVPENIKAETSPEESSVSAETEAETPAEPETPSAETEAEAPSTESETPAESGASAETTTTTAAPEAGTTDSGNCGDTTDSDDGSNVKWSYNDTTKTLTISGTGYMKNYDDEASVPWNT